MEAALTLDVPVHRIGNLRALLKAFPGVRLFRSGWIVQKVAIVGPQRDIEAIRPLLEAWQRDEAALDAW